MSRAHPSRLDPDRLYRRLIDAVYAGAVEEVRFVLSLRVIAPNHNQCGALCEAIVAGQPAVARALVKCGADPNFAKGLPMSWAITYGRADMVATLVDIGARLTDEFVAVSIQKAKLGASAAATLQTMLEHPGAMAPHTRAQAEAQILASDWESLREMQQRILFARDATRFSQSPAMSMP